MVEIVFEIDTVVALHLHDIVFVPLAVLRGYDICLRELEVAQCAARRLDSGSRRQLKLRCKRRYSLIVFHYQEHLSVGYVRLTIKHITGHSHLHDIAFGIFGLFPDTRRE